MTTAIIIGNMLSFAGSIVYFLSTLPKSKKGQLAVNTASSVVYIAGYVLFQTYSAIAVAAASMVRNLIAIRFEMTNRMRIAICTIMIGISICVNNTGIIGMLPVIASVISNVNICWVKDGRRFKAVRIADIGIWIVYYLIIQNYASAVVNAISITSLTIQLVIRKDTEDKQEKHETA